MASASVYYRFKSQKEPSRITFDGTGISVWDLKREIILQNKMGKGLDFDLAIYSQDTEDGEEPCSEGVTIQVVRCTNRPSSGTEFKDDNFIIPRSSQVIARRLPPSRNGKGSAAQYVADLQGGPSANANVTEARQNDAGGRRAPMHRGQMSMRFDGRDASASAGPSGSGGSGNNAAASGSGVGPVATLSSMDQNGDDEGARIAAMFQATTEQWDETQEKMAHATYRERGGVPRRGGPPRPMPSTHQAHHHNPVPDRPPPTGYICFRCGTKGHWIHDCPTNNDRDFDNKPRFKRTTGIPKSMLKTIEAPTDEMRRDGVMITPDGSYVVAQVDSASWARNQALRNKPLTKSDIYASVPSDSNLACSICNKLLRDAVRTPCCSKLFCQECIVNHLLEHEFQCAECDKRVKDLSTLARDDDVRKQVREYIEAEIEKSEKKIEAVEKAEKEELDKVQREKDEEKAKLEGANKKEESVETEDVKKEETEGGGDGNEQQQSQDGQQQEGMGTQSGWNPQAVQNIMTMLCNPQLPPPMRMQLQMQLQFMQNQFMQTMMQQQGNGAGSQQQQQQQQAAMNMQQQQQQPFGMQAANPYAGQHQMGMGYMGMGNFFPQSQPAASKPFRPAAPLSHQESAYMRLPVNQSTRKSTKRERPADFLELG